MRLSLPACLVVYFIAAGANAARADCRTGRPGKSHVIHYQSKPIAEFVFDDAVVKRPYLKNMRTPSGIQVTRNHPPKPGEDAVDHDTMHPGIWFAFGSLNGEDFWRNKGTIRCDGYQSVSEPGCFEALQADFTMLRADGSPLAKQTLLLKGRYDESLVRRTFVYEFESTIRSETDDLVFGDQEEMGLGVRMATPLIEKEGGLVQSADGRVGAKKIWGTVDHWVEYSGVAQNAQVGIRITPDKSNVRTAWWHTRDYGVFVANPFGKRSLPDGAAEFRLPKAKPLELKFTIEVFENR